MITETQLTPWPHEMSRGISIEPVFECGGVTYYRTRDAFSTFAGRGMKMLEVSEEWQNRMTNERLIQFIGAMENELNQPKITLTNIGNLIQKMKERVMFPVPTSELIFKMGSIAFFDATESPQEVDDAYTREKMKFWKKYGVDDFFLGMNLRDLMGFPDISKEDFERVSRVIQAMLEVENKTLPGALPNE